MRFASIALLLCGLLLIAGGVAYHAVNAERIAAAPAQVKDEPGPEELEPKVAAVPSTGPRERSITREIPADETALHDRLMKTMRSAKYAFNHPEVLYLTRRSQITLTLAADDRAALETLTKQFDKAVEGTVQTGTAKYTPLMTAVLAGRAFKIEPSGEQTRTVLLSAEGPVEWTWFVEPLEAGQGKLLRLSLFANVDQPGQRPVPIRIKTFEARINVDVKAWDRLVYEAKRMTPITQALTGLGGLVAFVGFLGTVYRWLSP
jgi:hypothetical protein